MTEVAERKQDGAEDDGYMRSEGTGEYSQMPYPHPVEAFQEFLMMDKIPIRGRPGEVKKKAGRSRRAWQRAVAVGRKTGCHDSGASE